MPKGKKISHQESKAELSTNNTLRTPNKALNKGEVKMLLINKCLVLNHCNDLDSDNRITTTYKYMFKNGF